MSLPFSQCNPSRDELTEAISPGYAAKKPPFDTAIAALEIPCQPGISYNVSWRLKHNLMRE
ncbi:hypothetical protein [Endozoicomonas sp. SESOKO2]|uniref:hypothetical protein n=1 Tax=Endozoicomonas sp. SESOKO2 TaxID=2828743 RepID=UPI0021498859|nr:hypothetical protein [Endozoicomonas sp. SESOKO2]